MWKEYFTFSGSERRGFIALTIIVCVLVVVRFSMDFILSPDEIDLTDAIAKVDSFQTSLTSIVDEKMTYNYSPFDPNNTSDEDWMRMGLTDRQIATIKKYLTSGGEFKTKEDFYKIYGIDKEIADSLVLYIVINEKENKAIFTSDIKEEIVINYIDFDPNTASDSVFMQLGLNSRIVNTIKKYREAGGEFKRKEDLKKIYGLDSILYNSIQPYIVIASKNESEESKDATIEKNYLIELNGADSIQLISLPGIGPVFSKRIIKYRNLLGGFADVNQLLEVYGFDDEILNQIIDLIVLDISVVTKISLNFASEKELYSHPYLNKEIAKAIVKFRSKKGNFISISQIRKENLIDEDTYQKIFPYLSLN